MQGRIIFINQPKGQTAGTGLIFGADRNRYRFELTEWRGADLPPRNMLVAFEPAGDTALQVHKFSESSFAGFDSDDDAPSPPPTTSKSSRKAASVGPVTDDIDDILRADPLPAEAATESSGLATGSAARLLLMQEPARRSPLKPILLGIGITVLVLILCVIYLHFTHKATNG